MAGPYSVLIVDDHVDSAETLKRKLEGDGFTTCTAPDGEGALIEFEKHRPNMVVLNATLPGMDGKQVCAILKSRTDVFFVPVILLSDLDTEEAMVAGFSAGADDYLRKTASYPELFARVKNAQRLQSLMGKPTALAADQSSYEVFQSPHDPVLKALADRMTPGSSQLFRVSAGGLRGTLGTRDYQFVHARCGNETGLAALEKMLLWTAEEVELVRLAPAHLESNVDAALPDVLARWLKEQDPLRIVREKLPPKTTFLRANLARPGGAESLQAPLKSLVDLFANGSSIDAAIRQSDEDAITSLGNIVELYYGGSLVRSAPRATDKPVAMAEKAAAAGDVAAARQALAEAHHLIELSGAETLKLRQDRDRLKAELDAADATAARLTGELEQSRTALEALQHALEENGKHAEEELEVFLLDGARQLQEIQDLKALLTPGQTDLHTLQNQLAEANATAKQLGSDLAESRIALATLQQETEDRGKPAAPGSADADEQLLESVRQEVEIRTLQAALEASREKTMLMVQAAEAENQRLKDEHASLLASLQADAATVPSIHPVQEPATAEFDTLLAEHKKRFEGASSEIERLENRLFDAVQKGDAAARETARLESELALALGSIEEHAETLAEVEELREKIAELEQHAPRSKPPAAADKKKRK